MSKVFRSTINEFRNTNQELVQQYEHSSEAEQSLSWKWSIKLMHSNSRKKVPLRKDLFRFFFSHQFSGKIFQFFQNKVGNLFHSGLKSQKQWKHRGIVPQKNHRKINFNFNFVNYSEAVTNPKSQGCHTARAESQSFTFSPVDSPTTANPVVFHKHRVKKFQSRLSSHFNQKWKRESLISNPATATPHNTLQI